MKKKKKIKFFILYDTFTEEERRQFKLFISSPLFNQGRKYSKILSFIESDRSVFFEFGNTKKERTLWNRLSELTKLAERFFVLKASEPETPEYNSLLLSELKKRDLDDYFRKHISDLKSGLKNTLLRNINIEEQLSVNKRYLEHLRSIPYSDKLASEFRETNNFKFALLIFEYLEYLIELQELKLSKSLSPAIFLEDFLQHLNFDEILLFVKEKANEIYPLIAFHYHIYNSLKVPLNPGHYQKAKKIFENDLTQIPEEYRVKFYGYLMRYNIEALNMQETSVNPELFNVMNKKLKEGLFSDIRDRNFFTNQFRNYVIVALSLNKFKWTKSFIDEYGPKLPREFRDDSMLLGKALLMFGKKEYIKCAELLNKFKMSNQYHYIDASHLRLKVCYELNRIEECHKQLRRLMEFLKSDHRFQDQLVKYMKIFCISYSLLLKLNQYPTKKNLTHLEFELNKGKLAGRRWIKEKMKEIVIR